MTLHDFKLLLTFLAPISRKDMFATIRILTNIKSYDDYNFKCCNKILFLELRIAPNPNGVLPLYPAGDCSKTPARAVSLLTNVLSFVVFRYRHMYWFKKIWSFTLYTSQQYLSSTSRMTRVAILLTTIQDTL